MQLPDPSQNDYGFERSSEQRDAANVLSQMAERDFNSRRPVRSRRTGCCLVNVLILLALAVSVGAFTHFVVTPLVPFGPTTLAVSAHPTLMIDSSKYVESYRNAPLLHIHAGNTQDKIILQAPAPWFFPLQYNLSTDKSTVILNMNNLPTDSLDITVPALTDLKVSTNSAAIQVDGVEGQMVLTSNSGGITVTNSHVHGPSLFENNTGLITARSDTLSEQVTFNNNAGAIMVDSSLSAGGSYQFKANGGAIDCSIPRNIAFHLDAMTYGGAITSDLPEMQVQNNQVHIDKGTSPHTSIMFYNNKGSITLHTQKGE